jgi:hypothetical protein
MTTRLARDPVRAQRHLDQARTAAIHEQRARELNGAYRTLDRLKAEYDQRPERFGPYRDRTRDGQLTSLIATWEQRIRDLEGIVETERLFNLPPDPFPPPDPVRPGRNGGPPAWKL